MGKTRNGDDLGWDDPLPEDLMRQWQRWQEAPPNLEEASLARCLHPGNFGPIAWAELHAFSDASEDAIGVAIYLRLTNHEDRSPGRDRHGSLQCHLPHWFKVVLGYIRNEIRRFYSYVANWVQIIRNVSSPDQWSFVDTNSNPADLATRGLHASKLGGSQLLEGPQFLREANWLPASTTQEATLAEDDPEVRRVTAHSTRITADLGTSRLSRFSSWPSLQRAVATLTAKTREVNGTRKKTRPLWHGTTRTASWYPRWESWRRQPQPFWRWSRRNHSSRTKRCSTPQLTQEMRVLRRAGARGVR